MEERDLILIERYLAGDATEAERMVVDQRRRADPVFRQELLELESARQALRLRQREELRKRFRRRDEVLDKKKPGPATRGRRNYFLWIGVAATILVLLLLIWNFFLNPGPSAVPAQVESRDSTTIKEGIQVQDSTMVQMPGEDEEDAPEKEDEDKPKSKEDAKQNMGGELFAANFEPYRDPMMDPTTRGESKPIPLDDFRKAYWEGKYQDVPALFQKLDVADQQNDNYRFQLANALMENGKVEEAIPILESIIQHNRSRFVAEAYYGLGMGYLEKGDEARAKESLEKYVKLEKAKQKEQANEIILKLK